MDDKVLSYNFVSLFWSVSVQQLRTQNNDDNLSILFKSNLSNITYKYINRIITETNCFQWIIYDSEMSQHLDNL